MTTLEKVEVLDGTAAIALVDTAARTGELSFPHGLHVQHHEGDARAGCCEIHAGSESGFQGIIVGVTGNVMKKDYIMSKSITTADVAGMIRKMVGGNGNEEE